MKKQILMTGLMIATMSLASCGRKAPQVDKGSGQKTTLALSTGDTCKSSNLDKGKIGKYSAQPFLAKSLKSYTEKTTDKKMEEFAKAVYKETIEDAPVIETITLKEIEIKGEKAPKKTKLDPRILVSINEGKAQEKFEMFLVKGGKNAKTPFMAYKVAFMKSECHEVKLPKDTPVEDTPAEDTPAEDTPAQDTPAQDDKMTEATDVESDIVYAEEKNGGLYAEEIANN